MSSATTATEPAVVGGWVDAGIVAIERPSDHAAVLRLRLPGRVPRRAGQHYVIRLTADDGYTASRSYSTASAPSDPLLELFVEELEDGEVSPYLAEAVEAGDELEVRGPIGGWFVWRGSTPALGVGGGTGVVPLVAMLRHARAEGRPQLLSLVAAARSSERLPYADELRDAGALVALSREGTAGGRPAGRLRADELAPLGATAGTAYVCGSARFAEATTGLLTQVGFPAGDIRVERFGPS